MRDFRTMLRSFCEFLSLFLILGYSIFLLKGNIGLGAEEIAELSRTRLDYSVEVIRSLSGQRADTWVGLAMLIAAFFLSCWNAMVAPRIADLGPPDRRGIFLATAFAALTMVAGWIAASTMVDNPVHESIAILEESPDRGRTTFESIDERPK